MPEWEIGGQWSRGRRIHSWCGSIEFADFFVVSLAYVCMLSEVLSFL